jgi:hypothetical protein
VGKSSGTEKHILKNIFRKGKTHYEKHPLKRKNTLDSGKIFRNRKTHYEKHPPEIENTLWLWETSSRKEKPLLKHPSERENTLVLWETFSGRRKTHCAVGNIIRKSADENFLKLL